MNAVLTIPTWLQHSEAAQTQTSMPTWLAHYRRQQWDAFIEQGVPTRHDDRWKYTDFSFLNKQAFSLTVEPSPAALAVDAYRIKHGDSALIVFVNGVFSVALSDCALLPAEVIACRMSDALQQHADLVQQVWPQVIDAKQYPFASLNAALFTDGLFLQVPDNCELSIPVHLLSIATDEHAFAANPHHVMVLGKNSKVTVIDEYLALSNKPYMMNVVTTIMAGEEAKLEYYKIQKENRHAVHMANTFVFQKQHSTTDFVNFSSGGLFARDDVIVKLQEAGAACHTSGFYQLHGDNQFVDHHVDIHHLAPRTSSEMLYKGILDKKSRAVFNGRLHVAKDAQKILAYQANHNLLLSNEAEVYSKPELEIYADDVKCKHGATTGQLNQEALFYMRSRGITHAEAMLILLRGFAEEVTQRIHHLGIKRRAQDLLG